MDLSGGYAVPFKGYEDWDKDTIPLVRFNQVREELHPEVYRSNFGDKFHQIFHVTKTLNITENYCFIPRLNLSYHEEGIVMRSFFCPIRQ